MRETSRWRWLSVFAAGLLIGQMIGPAVAWAAERIEVNWPDRFTVTQDRNWQVQVERPVEVKIDRYSLPEFTVNVKELPPVHVESGKGTVLHSAPTFAPLRETAEATWFVVGLPDGTAKVMKLLVGDGQGRVTEVSSFQL